MPQLDGVTYLPQVFWLRVVFFVFYLITVKNIVPTLSRILKVRAKKLSFAQGGLQELNDEGQRVRMEYDIIRSKALKESANMLQRRHEEARLWVNSRVQELTVEESKGGENYNGFYLAAVGEMVAKKAILLKLARS